MKSYLYIAFVIIILLLLQASAFGQQSLHLHSAEQHPGFQSLSAFNYESDLAPFELRNKAIKIEFDALHSLKESQSNSINVSLFDDEAITFDTTRRSSFGNRSEAVISASADGSPVYMIGAWKGDRYASNIMDYQTGRFYTVRFNADIGTHLLSEISYEEMNVLECGLSHTTEEVQLQLMQSAKNKLSDSSPPLPLIPSEILNNTTATIDVMLIHTPLAREWADVNEGGIDVSVSLMMAMSQFAMDISEIDLEFRLVALEEVDYNETAEPTLTHIMRLTAGPHLNLGPEFEGYLEDVHIKRDQFGADLVGMLAVISDVGGMAWILDTTEGRPDFAFSVNRIQQLTRSFTLVHEFGHNFGSNHSRVQSQNPAPAEGGLFEYSAGWRWTGTNGTSFASVMAYNEGSIPAPVFSNPNLSWAGTPTGTLDDPTGPANNALSVNEAKHVLAGYRPATIDPPEFLVSEHQIHIELMPGQEISYPLTVENNGDSRLNWRLGLDADEGQYESGNITQMINFTAEEGFPAGSYTNVNGWTAIPNNGGYSFEISSANPSTGHTHLRLPPGSDDPWVGAGGPQLLGLSPNYEVSFDVYFPKNLLFTVYLLSERQSARLFFFPNSIELVHTTLDFGTTRKMVQYNHKRDSYKRVNIIVSTDRNELILRYDDVEISRFISDNDIFLPDRILFYSQSATGEFINAPIDIDNLVFRDFDLNKEWISPIEKMAGSLGSNESDTINLSIRAGDLDFGTYRKELVFSSDDFQNPLVTVPVELIITDTPTSTPEAAELPENISLSQNYPNPFNPTTNITFNLAEAGDIRVDVYTIQGQRVATLAEGLHGAGSHNVSFDASRLASGMYIYRLRSGTETLSRTMMLVK